MKKFRATFMMAAAVILTLHVFPATKNDEAPVGPLTPKTILQRYGFIDEDGDGINDLARDSDNDGIPNCLDPDWARPRDGKGFQDRYGYRHRNAGLQADAPYNHSYQYLWNNSWANQYGPDPVAPGNGKKRNRRSNGKH